MKPQIVPLGDAALLVQFGNQVDLAVNRQVHALAARLRDDQPPGVIETVPSYASLLVHYDPLRLTFGEVAQWVSADVQRVEAAATSTARRIEIPVRYGGEDGPDLAAVAQQHHLSPRDAATMHASREYTVYMMGFTPGFAYMGMLDESLDTPRLPSPRLHVPAGSVAIADRQTGVYPINSPGGWRLIGRTSLPLFDLQAEQPFLLSPGDTVRFVIEGLNA